jgi:hypothetical protein
MRTPAQPRVNFFTSVSLETDKLRRRLQASTGYSTAELVTQALRLFEKHLSNFVPPKPNRPVRR